MGPYGPQSYSDIPVLLSGRQLCSSRKPALSVKAVCEGREGREDRGAADTQMRSWLIVIMVLIRMEQCPAQATAAQHRTSRGLFCFTSAVAFGKGSLLLSSRKKYHPIR